VTATFEDTILQRVRERRARAAEPRVRKFASPAAVARRFNPSWRMSPALELIDAALVELVDSDAYDALEVTMPPQEGKSTLCSRYFPEWALDYDRSLRYGIVSYEKELATRHGREIRQDVYLSNGGLDIQIRRDSTAAGRWATPQGGGVYCVGIGGALTGQPVDLLVIDDPVKDREQAESERYRQMAWDWWESVALTRLSPRAKVLLIQTRWHEDDLAGRIQARGSPLRWRRIKIPAIARPGDQLGRAPGEELQSARGRAPGYFRERQANMSSYVFASVYQQEPTAAEGNFYRRATFRHWRMGTPWPDGRETITLEDGQNVTLADCWRFATMDFAASTRTEADWTVLAYWAVSPMGDLILLDRARAQLADHQHFSLLPPLALRWGDATVYAEKSFFSKTFVTAARQAGVGVAEVIADADKVTRAIPAAGRVHAGKVFFPADASWLEEWEDEIASFPRGTHDDQADVLAYAERVRVAEWTPKVNPPPAGHDPVQAAIDAASHSAVGNGHGELDIMGQGW